MSAQYFANAFRERIASFKSTRRGNHGGYRKDKARAIRQPAQKKARALKAASAKSTVTPRALPRESDDTVSSTRDTFASPSKSSSHPTSLTPTRWPIHHSMSATPGPPIATLAFPIVPLATVSANAVTQADSPDWAYPVSTTMSWGRSALYNVHPESTKPAAFLPVPTMVVPMTDGHLWGDLHPGYASQILARPKPDAQLHVRSLGMSTPLSGSLDGADTVEAVMAKCATQNTKPASNDAFTTLWSPILPGCWQTLEDAEKAYLGMKTRDAVNAGLQILDGQKSSDVLHKGLNILSHHIQPNHDSYSGTSEHQL